MAPPPPRPEACWRGTWAGLAFHLLCQQQPLASLSWPLPLPHSSSSLVQIIGLDNSDGFIPQDVTLNIRMSEVAAFAISCCQRGNKRGVAVI